VADPPETSNTTVDAESDFIPLSGLQHYLYCPRQCALIHVEQQWAENRLTAEGRLLHQTTATPGAEARKGVRTATAMPLASRRLGVSGIADVVELHRDGETWRPFPVEYKRGKPKAHRADEVQLCAQAMALEEMFGCEIAEGALFYGATRRRQAVVFDPELRALTARIAEETRRLIRSGATPPPRYEKKLCQACSLKDICQPKQLGRNRRVAEWLARRIAEE
jgi:CRISPR-associated exonuclease Cas4